MKKVKKEWVSARLKKLLYKLLIVEKSKRYLKKELSKVTDAELNLRDKISREKKAIYLVNKAKKLR